MEGEQGLEQRAFPPGLEGCPKGPGQAAEGSAAMVPFPTWPASPRFWAHSTCRTRALPPQKASILSCQNVNLTWTQDTCYKGTSSPAKQGSVLTCGGPG